MRKKREKREKRREERRERRNLGNRETRGSHRSRGSRRFRGDRDSQRDSGQGRWRKKGCSRMSGRRSKSRGCSRAGRRKRFGRSFSRSPSESPGRLKKQRSSMRRRRESQPPGRSYRRLEIPHRQERRKDRHAEEEDSGESDREGHGKSLFLDNLHREADAKALRWLLCRDGSIEHIYISRKRRPNNNLAFAIIKMVSKSQVKRAVARIHGRTFMGHQLFARKARYEVFGRSEAGGWEPRKIDGKTEPENPGDGPVSAALSESGNPGGGPVSATLVPPTGKVGGSHGVGDDNNSWELQGDVELEIDGACAATGCGRVFGRLKGPTRVRIKNCRCCTKCHLHEEDASAKDSGKAAPCSKEEIVASDNGHTNSGVNYAGIPLSGVQNIVWNGALTWYPGWVYPLFPMLGVDNYGWWGQGYGGGYAWPLGSGTAWCPTGYFQHTQPPNATCAPGGYTASPSQGSKEPAVRAPISVRQPPGPRGSHPDPVVEDIVSNERRGMEDDVLHLDKFDSLEDVEADIGSKDGNGDALPRGTAADYAAPQDPLLDDDTDDGGLRRLFEDPEFPPGFEPDLAPPKTVGESEEAFVKEEARQTLSLAKKIGCSILDEKRALENIEGIIREQRESYRQRCLATKEGLKEDSDRYSRQSSKDGSSKVIGTRHLGFSKFSRTSRMARKGKKKAN